MSDVLVLGYHAAGPDWPAPMSIRPDRLESQLRMLLDRGYRGVTFTEAVARPPDGRVVAVTFDDAYRSVYEHARPVLEGLGLPATVFVPTAFAGAERPMSWPGISHWVGGPHERELVPMSWDQLADLVASGWEIGSHTRSHPRLPELPDDALHAELSGSRADCQHNLGVACTSIAYPYADCDRRVAAAAAAAGYAVGCAMSRRPRLSDQMLWPRVGIYRGDSDRRFRLKTSPFVRRARLGTISGVRRNVGRRFG